MNSTVSIRSLAHCSFSELYAAHVKAFKDYPFQWSKDALQKTIHRRGFDPQLSFGAFDNNELVSFTWNGIGEFKNIPTAYDTGTGTAQEYRGRGLASKIFEHSIPFLKEAGIEQYILEVLEENEKAFSVYSKQGFTVSRKFDCFRVNSNEWKMPARSLPKNIHVKEINLGFQKEMECMIDFDLSWQNNFSALSKNPNDLKILGAFDDQVLIAYGIIEPQSGDIPQLAVNRTHRRKGIGSMLLNELKKLNTADVVKIINIPNDQQDIICFIHYNSIPKLVSQYEMLRLI
jgi:ribosomal protein S18 acetylase RimI-like enzyme